MAATSYRLLFSDLLTGQINAEIPMTGVALTRQLNSAGTAQMHVQISDASSVAYNIVNSTQPGRTQVWIDRNGVLVFGGIIWQRTYTSRDQTLAITAQEFESYFAHRYITTTQGYTNVDPFLIAQNLVNQAQAVAGGNIGVVVPNNTSSLTVSKVYYSYELKSVLSAIQDLANANASSGGSSFDFAITYAYDGGGTPVKTLSLGYPRLGTAYSSSNLSAPVLEFPSGNILEYEYPETGTDMANIVYAIGAGSNEGKLIGTATDTSKITAGWPLLETTANYTDTADATLLGNLAYGQLRAVSTPPVAMKIVLNPSTDPVYGTYNLGDDVRVRIFDDRFPNGIDSTYRIMAISLAAGEAGPERVTLSVTIPQV
jgi:hypothetical protein